MNPYTDLPPRQLWKAALAGRNMFDIAELWSPKFNLLPEHRVSTFGSCFAQHIGRALAQRGYSWFDGEPAPSRLSAANQRLFNYGVFSCRTGNIYTASLFVQWLQWAFGGAVPTEHWEHEGRFYDPFRPRIEPSGFESPEELQRCRAHTLQALRRVVEESTVLVFTLGLTESWFNRVTGHEYPMCPGTAAGTFDGKAHEFRNQRFGEIAASLESALSLLAKANPSLRVTLTVSPVPLTATNSGRHVLVATVESKSILRAVAGECADSHDHVDYFPAYETITSPAFRGTFFEPNQRSVNHAGVHFVMSSFFNSLSAMFQPLQQAAASLEAPADGNAPGERSADVVCEEELLETFGATRRGD